MEYITDIHLYISHHASRQECLIHYTLVARHWWRGLWQKMFHTRLIHRYVAATINSRRV